MEVWLLPVVSVTSMEGKIKDMPSEVVEDLYRDASLLYKPGFVVQSGVLLPKVVTTTMGLPLHARWLTTAARDLRLYILTKSPT